MTKGVIQQSIDKHCEQMFLEFRCGRSKLAPKSVMAICELHCRADGTDRWDECGAGQTWRRVHERARRTLFTPTNVKDGPNYSDEVGEWRIPHGKLCDTGTRFVLVDNWPEKKNSNRDFGKFWWGETRFTKSMPISEPQ